MQIAKLLAEHLSSEKNFIYNGEFLYDTDNNPYWSELSGFDSLGLLVALPEAKSASLVANPAIKEDNVQVVGHAALDEMLSAAAPVFNETIKDELGLAAEPALELLLRNLVSI